MNKYVKGCLIIFAVLVVIFGMIAGWIWWTMKTSHKRAEEDGIKYSKECDTAMIISEKPSISLGEFREDEISQLKFYLIRNSKILKDTVLKYEILDSEDYLQTNIPFENFKKSDSIIVETKSKVLFTISDFHHYAYLHYGMFGYVGSHDCRFADESYMVNGEKSDGTLLKKNGIK